MTNPTPLDRAENGHIWHARVFASMQIKCCMNCGFIKNEKQPIKPCPYPIEAELRADTPLDRAIREAVEAERERCAAKADAARADIERQATLAKNAMIHDGMMMAADFMELLADAIREDQP